jgi:hypothetical protein
MREAHRFHVYQCSLRSSDQQVSTGRQITYRCFLSVRNANGLRHEVDRYINLNRGRFLFKGRGLEQCILYLYFKQCEDHDHSCFPAQRGRPPDADRIAADIADRWNEKLKTTVRDRNHERRDST